MITNQPASVRRTSNIHWPAALLLGLCLFGILALFSSGLSAAVLGAAQIFSQQTAPVDSTQIFLLAAGLILEGLVLVPAMATALLHLLGDIPPISNGLARLNRIWARPVLWVWLIPLVVVLGALALQVEEWTWLLLPPLHIFAVGLPVLLLVYLALRDLPAGPPLQRWGVFAGGMLIGPFLILIAELAAMLAALVAFFVYLSARPDLSSELQLLVTRLSYAATNPQDLAIIARPYLMKPFILFGALAFVAGLVPLIEEFFKPVGVWFLAGRPLTGAEGFAAGILSGAGYALFENVTHTTMGGDWVQIILLRMGAALLHITATGIMGWGLGLAWSRRNYLGLGLAFLTAVALHGTWNGLSTLMSVQQLLEMKDPSVVELSPAFAGLILLTILLMALLVLINARLRAPDRAEPGRAEPDLAGELEA